MPETGNNEILNRAEAGSARFGIIGVVVAGGCVLALGFWLSRHNSQRAAPEQAKNAPQVSIPAETISGADENLPQEVPNEKVGVSAGPRAPVVVSRSRPADSGQAVVARPEPSPVTRDLVNRISNLDQNSIPRTGEQVNAWKQNLQQLVQQGSAAVPAIREFLEKNVDLGFGTEASQALGYGSARYAMFDALAQIGGPEATQAMLDTLQTVADPREIAMLARNLERLSPDAHTPEILEATRQALAMAGEGKLGETDVGPLFELLYKYGGTGIATELEQGGARWRYYSAIALAQLPDGAGVPSLIRMVQDPAGGPVKNVPALEMLAQSATQSADAGAALLDLVRNNKIPGRLWPYLTAALSGDRVQYRDSSFDSPPVDSVSGLKTFHIAAGNQNFYSVPAPSLTSEAINQQIRLIDGLLGATSDPSAVQALQTARNSLVRRQQ
jgi:hypothetical protein